MRTGTSKHWGASPGNRTAQVSTFAWNPPAKGGEGQGAERNNEASPGGTRVGILSERKRKPSISPRSCPWEDFGLCVPLLPGTAGGCAEWTQRVLPAGTSRPVNRVGTPHSWAWEEGAVVGWEGPSRSGSQTPTASVRSTPEPSGWGGGARHPQGLSRSCPTTTMGGPGWRREPWASGAAAFSGLLGPAKTKQQGNSNSPVGMASFTALEEALFESRGWGEGSGLGVRRPPPPTPTSHSGTWDQPPHPAWAPLPARPHTPRPASRAGTAVWTSSHTQRDGV